MVGLGSVPPGAPGSDGGPTAGSAGASKKTTAPFTAQDGDGPRKKKPASMVGLGTDAGATDLSASDSVRAPSAGAPLDDIRPGGEDEGAAAIGRVKLQKVPASSVASSSPSSPPARGALPLAAHSGRQSRPPGDIFNTVVSVLVVDRAASQARIRSMLPQERFEIVAAADPEEALRLSRSVAPDLVLIDREVAQRDGAELIARLRSDPLTDLVPIALLYDGDEDLDADELREMGADAQIRRDGLEEKLVGRLESLTAVAGSYPSVSAFGEATLEEVAQRLAREIQRGIVDAAVEGRRLRIPLGRGSDLLAAAWSTIAKVRAELTEASDGQVRFRDAGGRGGPAFVSLVADGSRAAAEDELDPVSLAGVRIIVADDDPAVVWFFAGLFREEGAVVVEVEDGLEALEAARAKRPDLIVSDILMPRMDGLMLCRQLERDPALAEVPVILISWKEDFLQRMRELRAGASGYLRKEAASGQILQRVREVLRPRLRLENQLDGTGEVRGRIEGIGVIPLLRAVARLRSDARIAVRDAWNLYEIDIREGSLKDVTRTATDGSFARGRRALTQLLGVTAGRFAASPSDTAIRPSLPDGDSDSLLAEAAAELGAFVDAVSGKGLAAVGRIRFDGDVAAAFARTSPSAQRAVAEALMEGARPRDLLVSGEFAPHVVEEALVDLARRGAVVAVEGPQGEDLVAVARRERGGAQAHVPPSALVHPGGRTEDLDGSDPEPSLFDAPTNAPPSALGEATRDSVVGLASASADEDDADPALPLEPPTTEVENVVPADSDMLIIGEVKPPPRPPKRAPRVDAVGEREGATPGSEVPTPADEVAAKSSTVLDDAPTTVKPSPASVTVEAQASSQSDEGGGMGVVGWLLLIALCGVVGYFGYNFWRAHQVSDRAPEPAQLPLAEPEVPSEPERTEEVDEVSEPASAAEAAGLGFGETVDEVLAVGVEVGEGEGLLVVQAADSGEAVEVLLRDAGDERALGEAPVRIALPEGRHRLLFRRGEREQFRYLFVGQGQTRVVDPDTM